MLNCPESKVEIVWLMVSQYPLLLQEFQGFEDKSQFD